MSIPDHAPQTGISQTGVPEISVPEILAAKRDGHELSREQLSRLILGYVGGAVPDYQVSAFLMAAFLRGLSPQETADLTEIMADSGDRLDLSALPHTADKHSTGGVGDKTSLVLMPMLAALGFTVAKMSGRGLAHTGGTVDKLESIPGWRAQLSEEEFLHQARATGLVLVGQSRDLAPADGLLYALRDVTGTVESLPLIASSIMSKKLASGSHTIVLDVKVGAGAFMKTPEDGRALAEAMVDIGRRAGRQVSALLTDMERPLGRMAGNALEVHEAVQTLKGEGPGDLRELCVALAAAALRLRGEEGGAERAREVLDSGAALGKFAEFVAAQGGDAAAAVEQRLAVAPDHEDITAPRAGFVSAIDALSVGRAVLALGGGRERKEDAVDHAVGVELLRTVGEPVREGEPVLRLWHRERGLERARELLRGGLTVDGVAPPARPLVLGEVE